MLRTTRTALLALATFMVLFLAGVGAGALWEAVTNA